MTQWYVKDLSKLTQVSVQTLHHYDRIGLLKPSVRLPNGYRLYSEKDLLKLQRIIALKFFGFELAQIKTLLATDGNIHDHFSVQSQFLEEKAKTLFDASKVLKKIMSNCSRNKSIPWEAVIESIEVYRMTQQLEKNWVSKVLSPEELRDYVSFTQDLKKRFTPNEKKVYEDKWAELIRDIDANLDKDPTSPLAINIAKQCMDWVNSLYGKKHASLRMTVWEKGFKGGHGEEYGMSPKAVAWLDKAIYAYHEQRIFNILNKVETHSHQEVTQLWEDLLMDMYGDAQAPKDELVKAVLKDKKTSQAVKNWLKQISQS